MAPVPPAACAEALIRIEVFHDGIARDRHLGTVGRDSIGPMGRPVGLKPHRGMHIESRKMGRSRDILEKPFRHTKKSCV